MFSSWPVSALVAGREDRLGQLAGFLQAGRQLDAADGLRFLVFLPARAGEVAAHDAFDGQRFRLFHNHAAAGELAGEGLQILRQRIAGAGDEVVRLERFRLREPEIGNLRQHLAFARDAVGHDDVEGGDAVGGDEEQAVAQIKYLPHLAAFEFFDARQIELQNRFVCHARIIKARRPQEKPKVVFTVGVDVRSL